MTDISVLPMIDQFKRKYEDWMGEAPNGDTSFLLGALAAAAGVCVMIPMDTVKTRLVIQVTSLVIN